MTTDVESAARLVALGMRPRQLPSRDVVYADLVARYAQDDDFRSLVHEVAAGLDLVVLAVTRPTGAVLAAREGSVFEIRMDEYAKRTAIGGRRAAEKVIHGLIHLAVAALSFPRPDDLANDTYVGRVSVDQVDATVREACRMLEERAKVAEENSDPPEDAPELERVWRAYARRPSAATARNGRLVPDSTRGMTAKAMRFLSEQGLLAQVNGEDGGTYRTTPRYQIQVRELASVQAFDELLGLGVVAVPDAGGSLRAVSTDELSIGGSDV